VGKVMGDLLGDSEGLFVGEVVGGEVAEKTYAAPLSTLNSSSFQALTKTVVSKIATLNSYQSLSCPSFAVSLPTSSQLPLCKYLWNT
jgi:hypothetical protein